MSDNAQAADDFNSTGRRRRRNVAAVLANPGALPLPMAYTEQAVGSGSLDGVAFTDAAVVLTTAPIDTAERHRADQPSSKISVTATVGA